MDIQWTGDVQQHVSRAVAVLLPLTQDKRATYYEQALAEAIINLVHGVQYLLNEHKEQSQASADAPAEPSREEWARIQAQYRNEGLEWAASWIESQATGAEPSVAAFAANVAMSIRAAKEQGRVE